jgi:chemotaxis family two-component system response regulator Rcp1
MSRLTVLHVEDSANDALQVQMALETADPQWRCAIDLRHVLNVEQARPVLRDRRPHLVVLDLNLPGLSGHDLLAEMKGAPATRHIPVVVLSTSANAGDVDRAYRGGAACYLVKPESFVELVTLMGEVRSFWLRRVALPM